MDQVAAGPITVLLPCPDPARCIFGDARGLVVEGRVSVRLSTGQHKVDCADQLVRQGDDRLLMAAADHQTVVLGTRTRFWFVARRLRLRTEDSAGWGCRGGALRSFGLPAARLLPGHVG